MEREKEKEREQGENIVEREGRERVIGAWKRKSDWSLEERYIKKTVAW